jgi:hypothetical protein
MTVPSSGELSNARVAGRWSAGVPDRNFRVYGEPDAETGRPTFRDYRIAVADLEVTIASNYDSLIDDEATGEPDRLDYTRRR